jgi:hypothetical protein
MNISSIVLKATIEVTLGTPSGITLNYTNYTTPVKIYQGCAIMNITTFPMEGQQVNFVSCSLYPA